MADETNQENIETSVNEDSAGIPSKQDFDATANTDQTDIPASTEKEQVGDGGEWKTADGRVLKTHQEVQEFLDTESKNQQADYTKKTQELARQREQLGTFVNIKEACEQNPKFAEHFRNSIESFDPDGEGDGNAAIRQFEKRLGMMEINQEVKELQAGIVKGGQPELTVDQVNDLAKYATRNGGIELKEAYKLKNYDKDLEQARIDGAKSYQDEQKKKVQSGDRVPPTHVGTGTLGADTGEQPVFKSSKDVSRHHLAKGTFFRKKG